MSKTVQLTQEGLDELKAELAELKGKKLPAVISRVTAALAHGDLSENAEYHDAKEEQRFVETRISELEDILSRAVVVKQTTSASKVGLGSVVRAHLKSASSKHLTFHIVGEFEANPGEGKISSVSPLGKAFFAKKKGDAVVVNAPAGEITYIIDSIE